MQLLAMNTARTINNTQTINHLALLRDYPHSAQLNLCSNDADNGVQAGGSEVTAASGAA